VNYTITKTESRENGRHSEVTQISFDIPMDGIKEIDQPVFAYAVFRAMKDWLKKNPDEFAMTCRLDNADKTWTLVCVYQGVEERLPERLAKLWDDYQWTLAGARGRLDMIEDYVAVHFRELIREMPRFLAMSGTFSEGIHDVQEDVRALRNGHDSLALDVARLTEKLQIVAGNLEQHPLVFIGNPSHAPADGNGHEQPEKTPTANGNGHKPWYAFWRQ
jgi:hypothetical protein